MSNLKILSQQSLIKIASNLREKGKKIVTYNGSFDIIHSGHVNSIQEAKKHGDILLILINSDNSVKSYKGPHRPIVKEKERAEIVAGIEGVDYVTVFDDVTPIRILDKIKPQVHCNGSDWGQNCVERAVVEKNGGEISILKWKRNLSTSRLIRKIVKLASKPVAKAIFLSNSINPEKLNRLSEVGYKLMTLNHKKIIQTATIIGIRLSDSWLIASRQADIITGRNANVKTIKLGSKMPTKLKLEPNFYAKDIAKAAEIILG